VIKLILQSLWSNFEYYLYAFVQAVCLHIKQYRLGGKGKNLAKKRRNKLKIHEIIASVGLFGGFGQGRDSDGDRKVP
jgi:hypothetical protein